MKQGMLLYTKSQTHIIRLYDIIIMNRFDNENNKWHKLSTTELKEIIEGYKSWYLLNRW